MRSCGVVYRGLFWEARTRHSALDCSTVWQCRFTSAFLLASPARGLPTLSCTATLRPRHRYSVTSSLAHPHIAWSALKSDLQPGRAYPEKTGFTNSNPMPGARRYSLSAIPWCLQILRGRRKWVHCPTGRRPRCQPADFQRHTGCGIRRKEPGSSKIPRNTPTRTTVGSHPSEPDGQHWTQAPQGRGWTGWHRPVGPN